MVWCALQLPVYLAGDISVLHMFSCIMSRKSGLASLGSSPMKIQQNVATQKVQLTIFGAFLEVPKHFGFWTLRSRH